MEDIISSPLQIEKLLNRIYVPLSKLIKKRNL
jgi:hypothetical protein